MLRTFLALCWLLLSANCVNSQSSLVGELDSLKTVVNSRSGSVRAELQVLIARISNKVGEYDSAEVYANSALSLPENEDPDTIRIDALIQIGIVKLNQGSHIEAMENFHSVLEKSEKLNDRKRISKAWHHLGVVYSYDKQYRQAIGHYTKAIQERAEIGDSLSSELINSQIMLGQAYIFAGSFDTSLVWLSKAYQGALRNNAEESIMAAVYYLGLNYRCLKEFEDALEALFEAKQMAKALGNNDFVSVCYQSIAGIYKLQGKYYLSIVHLDSALQIAQKIGNKRHVYESLYGLAYNYQKLAQHAKAYDYLIKYVSAKDSVLKEENGKAMAEMKAKYEAEKQDQKIVLLESQGEARRLQLQVAHYWQYGLIAATILFTLVIIVLLNRFLIKRRLSMELHRTNQELEIEKENMELKALLSQMNPHFIFNSLNSIQEFIATNDKENAHEYLSLFGRLIRRTLDNSNRQMVPITEEILNIEEYVRLESLRVENFSFKLEINPDIDIYNLCIPPMLIQPYIENAIWHGITNLDRPGVVNLKIDLEGERLKCIVQDDGVGRGRSAGQKVKSDLRKANQPGGMSITRKRVQTLWSNKKHDFDVEIIDLYDKENQASGTIVQLDIPYEY